MIRHCVICSIAMAICLSVSPCSRGESTTLEVTIVEPQPLITTSDVIRLHARTLENVFPDLGQTSSSSFMVEGFEIQWSIISEWTHSPFPVATPLAYSSELGPLPAGDYHLTATWTPVEDTWPAEHPAPGYASLSFSVIPEPLMCVILLSGVLAGVLSRNRRRLGTASQVACRR